jgi:hypothetical protein
LVEFNNSFIGSINGIEIDVIDITKINSYHSEIPVNGLISNATIEIIDIEKINVYIPMPLPETGEYEAYVITETGIMQVGNVYVITIEGLKEADTIEVIGGEDPIPKEGRVSSRISNVVIEMINV